MPRVVSRGSRHIRERGIRRSLQLLIAKRAGQPRTEASKRDRASLAEPCTIRDEVSLPGSGSIRNEGAIFKRSSIQIAISRMLRTSVPATLMTRGPSARARNASPSRKAKKPGLIQVAAGRVHEAFGRHSVSPTRRPSAPRPTTMGVSGMTSERGRSDRRSWQLRCRRARQSKAGRSCFAVVLPFLQEQIFPARLQ